MEHDTNLSRGDLVQVLSASEILDTLDDDGFLEALPFMPEMVAHCGHRYRVERRADKICDTITYTGSRDLTRSVLLDQLRCDGGAHGGCQAECRLFWKEAWLKRVEPGDRAATELGLADPGAEKLLRQRVARNVKSTVDRDRYRCQATELVEGIGAPLQGRSPGVPARAHLR